MAQKKADIKKIENSTSRQVTYAKRREAIVKKANELSVLCNTDVGVIMFSPDDRLTAFASNQRVEDTFLRFVDRPDQLKEGHLNDNELLSLKLRQIKHEREMLEKIAAIQELEEKLNKIKRRQREMKEKMRYYQPNVEKINSVVEAGAYQQYLATAIQRIQLKRKDVKENEDGYEPSALDAAQPL